MDLNHLVYPMLSYPATREDAFTLASRLTGEAWDAFSPGRHAPKSAWDLLGGQAFLAKRIKGHETAIVQPLCYLCGHGVLTPEELIIALGRRPKVHRDGKLEEQVTGDMRSRPFEQLTRKIHQYGAELYPTGKYIKEIKPYDRDLPEGSEIPFIYVLKDERGDVKVGISKQPKMRFRQIEAYEQITIRHYAYFGPSPYALKIEQTLLCQYGAGRHPTKKSQEWLIKVSFDEVADAIRSALIYVNGRH